MTKADELRGKIIDMAQGVSWNEMEAFLTLLDDYAAAAERQAGEKILKYCDTHPFMRPQDAIDSALAPATKEADRGNS